MKDKDKEQQRPSEANKAANVRIIERIKNYVSRNRVKYGKYDDIAFGLKLVENELESGPYILVNGKDGGNPKISKPKSCKGVLQISLAKHDEGSVEETGFFISLPFFINGSWAERWRVPFLDAKRLYFDLFEAHEKYPKLFESSYDDHVIFRQIVDFTESYMLPLAFVAGNKPDDESLVKRFNSREDDAITRLIPSVVVHHSFYGWNNKEFDEVIENATTLLYNRYLLSVK